MLVLPLQKRGGGLTRPLDGRDPGAREVLRWRVGGGRPERVDKAGEAVMMMVRGRGWRGVGPLPAGANHRRWIESGLRLRRDGQKELAPRRHQAQISRVQP